MSMRCYKCYISKVWHHIKCRLTGSLSPGDQGLAKIADVEHSWCFDIIPVLLGEGVHTEMGWKTFRSTQNSSIGQKQLQPKHMWLMSYSDRLASNQLAEHTLEGHCSIQYLKCPAASRRTLMNSKRLFVYHKMTVLYLYTFNRWFWLSPRSVWLAKSLLVLASL